MSSATQSHQSELLRGASRPAPTHHPWLYRGGLIAALPATLLLVFFMDFNATAH